MRSSPLRAAALAVAAAALAAACSNSSSVTSGTTGQISVRLTDAPIVGVQSATVWVSRVYMIGGADSTGPQYTLSSTATSYDLLALQGGVSALLGSATIPVGDYTQLRLVVDSARITLDAGLLFSNGLATATVKVASGAQTGIKVIFDAPLHIVAGHNLVVADFDASQSFVLFGPSVAPIGVLFKPVIHATAGNLAAMISGTVTASARARLFAIFAANGDTAATADADSVSGAYTLRFLTPGSYTVTAVGTAQGSTLHAQTSLMLRADEDTSGVNFQ